MQVWAEPFTKLRLGKIYNLYQDPFERADITSNTFWDWQINHVGQIYGAMDDVGAFAASFKEFPPRSFPPSFVPTNILEETVENMKDDRRRAGQRSQSIDKIRSGVNQMIEQQLQERAVRGVR
jgi:arylsulfatase